MHLVVLEIREPVPVSGEIYGITVKKRRKKNPRELMTIIYCVL